MALQPFIQLSWGSDASVELSPPSKKEVSIVEAIAIDPLWLGIDGGGKEGDVRLCEFLYVLT